MSKYLINKVDLGKRTVGYEVYSTDTKEVIGLTEKQVNDILSNGDTVYGFILGSDGNLQLDRDGFHTTNIMIKTGISNLKPLELTSNAAGVFYTLLTVYKNTHGAEYEVITSRFARTTISESRLRALLEVGCLTSGCYLDQDGNIGICEGVDIVDQA